VRAMSVTLRPAGSARGSKPGAPGPRYKWVALSNTTLGALLASINTSIMLIALPDVFRGIGIDPIKPGNGSLLLGHLPAPPRLWLQPNPAVGRHLPAAAHCRVLAGRDGLGLSVGPFRRAPVRQRRHGGRRGLVPAAGPAPRRLRLLAVRLVMLLNGIGMGLFTSPNRAGVMNSLRPASVAPEPEWRKHSRTPARCCPPGSSSRCARQATMSRPVSSSTPRSAVRQPGAKVFQPNRVAGVRGRGHYGQAAVAQHAAGTGGAAQMMRIERRRITRSATTLARTTKSPRRARRRPGQGGNHDSAGGNSAGAGTSAPGRRPLSPGPVPAPAAARSRSGRAGPVPVAIGPRPSSRQPAEPGGTARPGLRRQPARRLWF